MKVGGAMKWVFNMGGASICAPLKFRQEHMDRQEIVREESRHKGEGEDRG